MYIKSGIKCNKLSSLYIKSKGDVLNCVLQDEHVRQLLFKKFDLQHMARKSLLLGIFCFARAIISHFHIYIYIHYILHTLFVC